MLSICEYVVKFANQLANNWGFKVLCFLAASTVLAENNSNKKSIVIIFVKRNYGWEEKEVIKEAIQIHSGLCKLGIRHFLIPFQPHPLLSTNNIDNVTKFDDEFREQNDE